MRSKRRRARLRDFLTNTVESHYIKHLDEDIAQMGIHNAIARLNLRKAVGVAMTSSETWKRNIGWVAAMITDISKR